MNGTEAITRYVDIRQADTSEKLSLDLARHLPRRLCAGPAVIIADKPALLLPVLRKRWMRIIREVERQRSSTLMRERRQALEKELERLRSFSFGTSAGKRPSDALIVQTSDCLQTLPACTTLYVTTKLAPETLESLTGMLPDHTLLVMYQSEGAADNLTQHNADRP